MRGGRSRLRSRRGSWNHERVRPNQIHASVTKNLPLNSIPQRMDEQQTNMSIPKLVGEFYERIWNAGDLDAVVHLLSEDFLFRGSLGSERRGCDGFADYVRSVHNALSNYRCEILECVMQDNRALAKMRASAGQCPGGEQVWRYSSVTVWRGVCLTHQRRHKHEREGNPSLNTEVR